MLQTVGMRAVFARVHFLIARRIRSPLQHRTGGPCRQETLRLGRIAQVPGQFIDVASLPCLGADGASAPR